MNLLLLILLAFVGAVALAFLIVKFVPLKLRGVISLLLVVLSAFLIWKIYGGIMNPIKFKEEKQKRYAKVIEQLKLIRDAEERYKQVYGVYSKDESTLSQFVKTGKLAITETKNIEKTIRKRGGITTKISVKKVDTVGYEPVSKYFKNKNLDNLFSVPGTDKKFDVEIGKVEKIKGLFVPVFCAKVHKTDILKGMNKNELKLELQKIQNNEVKGEFVSVGSLEEVTVSGNWPPMYDKNVKKEDDKK